MLKRGKRPDQPRSSKYWIWMQNTQWHLESHVLNGVFNLKVSEKDAERDRNHLRLLLKKA